ncbi:DUF6233 domain-containing protein [Streptomyces sp. M41]|uniref:DUF6233 domain-containing protein n=1 Tax=Streptomyces sp. M41 TaxID=3059412 RepID=UPI00374C962C
MAVTSHPQVIERIIEHASDADADHGHRIKNMFDDLPPDLERLQTLRVWHALWVERIDHKIAALLRRQAEQERGRRDRPRPAEWIVELGIGADGSPVEVHAGDCHMAGRRRRAISRDEARRLLSAGLRACSHCEPDARLHIIDLGPPGSRARGVAPIAPPARPGRPWQEQTSRPASHARRPGRWPPCTPRSPSCSRCARRSATASRRCCNARRPSPCPAPRASGPV